MSLRLIYTTTFFLTTCAIMALKLSTLPLVYIKSKPSQPTNKALACSPWATTGYNPFDSDDAHDQHEQHPVEDEESACQSSSLNATPGRRKRSTNIELLFAWC